MKRARLLQGSKPPEHNALRSRGCPDPDHALVARRERAPQRRRQVSPSATPAIPMAFAVENLRRQWESAVSEVRRLKVAGEDYSSSAHKARTLRYQLVAMDPSLELESRAISVDTGSDVNPVKAV